jgi:hypothetical protein
VLFHLSRRAYILSESHPAHPAGQCSRDPRRRVTLTLILLAVEDVTEREARSKLLPQVDQRKDEFVATLP